MRDEFLAVLGHELRNPLAAISTAMQVIAGGVSPTRRAYLDELIHREVGILRRLVDDLLDLSRMTHGQIELKKGPTDLARVLESAMATSKVLIAARGQELDIHIPARERAVRGRRGAADSSCR